MDKIKLSELIALRIRVDGPLTFADLEAKAVDKGIALELFYSAMEMVNKRKDLHITGTTYKKKEQVVPTFNSHLEWTRKNYPPMIPGVNDANHEIFAGIDLSFLFMTPDEAKEYRLLLKGGRQNTTRYYQTPQK